MTEDYYTSRVVRIHWSCEDPDISDS